MSDKWVKRFSVDASANSGDRISAEASESDQQASHLQLGWAIPQRSNRRFTSTQRNFLNQLFEGEMNKSKVTPEQAHTKMKETLQPDQFLPVNSIKGYFSRRALGFRVGKETLGEILVQENVEKHMELEEDEDSEESEDDVEMEDESDDRDNNIENKLMEGRKTAVQNILSRVDVPDLKKDEWIAVNMGSCWYPAQFDKYDTDTEEI